MQFRFTAGAPDTERKFYAAQRQAQQRSENACMYPSLYVSALASLSFFI